MGGILEQVTCFSYPGKIMTDNDIHEMKIRKRKGITKHVINKMKRILTSGQKQYVDNENHQELCISSQVQKPGQ